MAQRGGRGDEGVVVAAEGAVVLARRPSVEFGAEQGQREGQAHARQRLRLGDDVGGETHAFEAEEGAGAAAARLNIVDDEQRAMRLRERRSEEHTSELQSLMRISYAVFCLKKKNKHHLKQ